MVLKAQKYRIYGVLGAIWLEKVLRAGDSAPMLAHKPYVSVIKKWRSLKNEYPKISNDGTYY